MDVKQDTQLTWSFEEDKFPVGFEQQVLGALPTKLARGGHPSIQIIESTNFQCYAHSGTLHDVKITQPHHHS